MKELANVFNSGKDDLTLDRFSLAESATEEPPTTPCRGSSSSRTADSVLRGTEGREREQRAPYGATIELDGSATVISLPEPPSGSSLATNHELTTEKESIEDNGGKSFDSCKKQRQAAISSTPGKSMSDINSLSMPLSTSSPIIKSKPDCADSPLPHRLKRKRGLVKQSLDESDLSQDLGTSASNVPSNDPDVPPVSDLTIPSKQSKIFNLNQGIDTNIDEQSQHSIKVEKSERAMSIAPAITSKVSCSSARIESNPLETESTMQCDPCLPGTSTRESAPPLHDAHHLQLAMISALEDGLPSTPAQPPSSVEGAATQDEHCSVDVSDVPCVSSIIQDASNDDADAIYKK